MKKLLVLAVLPALLILFSCGGGSRQQAPAAPSGALLHPSVKKFSDKIVASPNDASLYYQRGLALKKLAEDSLALNDFNKAVSLDTTKAAYYSAIGDLMFEHKDITNSVIWFKKAIKLDPKDPVAHLKFAKLLIYLNKMPESFAEINDVLRRDPFNPEGYFLKGIIYKNTNDTPKAISSFQTAIQVDPRYRDAMIQLGLLHAAQKDSVCIKYFNNAFALDTTDVLPLYGKAMYFQEGNNYEKAKEVYKQCILYDPQYGNAYFNIGWILMHQDSLEKAERQFDYVTRIEPNNAEAYYNRGVCRELQEKTQPAIADYKQAVEFDPEYQEAKDALKRLGGS
jgi:tetratricopeptide (TPR) repeat protein